MKTGSKHSPETLEKMRQSKKGKTPKNFHEIQKIAWKNRKGSIPWNKGTILPQFSGENSPHWIKDRSKVIKKQQRNDSAYCAWRRQVWVRDGFKCRIANNDCEGKIVAHHILPWRDYVELRYEINNGITLCRAHHPLKRAEEKRLVLTFQELVSVSKI